MRELVVGRNDAGQRFDKFLAKYMPLAPKSFFYKMLRKKNITVNGKKTEGDVKLNEGDIIKLFLSDETIDGFMKAAEFERAEVKFSVVYEDENILLVNKPAGVLSQKAEENDVSLVEMIITYLYDKHELSKDSLNRFKPSICNRIDRNTTGIVTAGKSLAGLQILSKAFKERLLDKYYYCIVSGKISEERHVSGYLSKDNDKNIVKIISQNEFECLSKKEQENYSRIETMYMPVSSTDDYTFLKVRLITGKAHQIRAHLAYEGHPVIGDYKYGSRNINQIFKKEYGIDSQLLHAAILTFKDMPGGFEYLSDKSFEAPLPEKFLKVKEGLGL